MQLSQSLPSSVGMDTLIHKATIFLTMCLCDAMKPLCSFPCEHEHCDARSHSVPFPVNMDTVMHEASLSLPLWLAHRRLSDYTDTKTKMTLSML